MKQSEIFEKVNKKIIENIEKAGSFKNLFDVPTALNIVSGYVYSGLNVALTFGYEKPFFATFNQIQKQKNWKLKKGSKSTFIVFWKCFKKNNKNELVEENGENEDKENRIFLLKYYNVFNIKNIEIPEDDKIHKKIKSFFNDNNKEIKNPQEIVNNYLQREKIKLNTGIKAFYMPSSDEITIPTIKSFENSKSYYSVLFHEMTHSTGAKTRLKRVGITNYNNFGSERYSKEELIAEIGASYLNSIAGIKNDDTEKKNLSYLKSWLAVFKNDKKMLLSAFPQAQKATNFILQN